MSGLLTEKAYQGTGRDEQQIKNKSGGRKQSQNLANTKHNQTNH